MAKYEYIRLQLDYGDLSQLNRLGSVGFHVVAVNEGSYPESLHWVLLEREITDAVSGNDRSTQGSGI